MLPSEFDNHQFFRLLDQLRDSTERLKTGHPDDERVHAISKRVDYLKWVFENSSPELISQGELNNLQNPMQNIASLIDNPNNFTQLENYFSAISAVFPYPRVQRIFRSEINSVIDDATLQFSELEQQVVSLRDGVNVVREQFKATESDIREKVGETEGRLEQVGASVDAKLNEFETQVSAQISEKMAEFSERFSKAQGERSEEFQALQNSISKSLSDGKIEIQNLKNANEKQLIEAGEALNQRMQKLQASANKIVDNLQGIYDEAGQTALAADFAGNGQEEHRRYFFFSVVASVFFVVAAGVLGFLWYQLAGSDKFEFSDLFMRLPVSLVFLLPAFYFATIANSHRRSSIKLRSLGLRIKSFGAYLTPAENEEKIGLRAKMVQEFFAEKDEEPKKRSFFDRGGEKHAEEVLELLRKVLEKSTPS